MYGVLFCKFYGNLMQKLDLGLGENSKNCVEHEKNQKNAFFEFLDECENG